jgi:hypothetical protein
MEFQAYVYLDSRDIVPICILSTLYVFYSGAENFLHYTKNLLVPEQWLYLPFIMIGQEKSGV